MITWYSISLLVVAVLLTLLVIRLSEVSTRMHTLENAITQIIEDNEAMHTISAQCVTHKELHAVLRHTSSPLQFTVGK
jgi:macrodomain Ter protein organizer (MatP/YcbG family)